MITLGIDISSQAKNTAACRIEWHDGQTKIDLPYKGCNDVQLDALIAGQNGSGKCDFVGIDAPFGWPVPFKEAVAQWKAEQWTDDLRREMCFRATDREISEVFKEDEKIFPLSVSSNLIALPAMRTMALLKRHGVIDRSGSGRFIEVYPAASLRRWKLGHKGYKSGADAKSARQQILSRLREALPTFSIPDDYAETDHALDALIAALTARAAALGHTEPPGDDTKILAQEEGWIHLPDKQDIGVCLWPKAN